MHGGRPTNPSANVGVPALRLLAAVAGACGDDALRGSAVVVAAGRDPNDDAIDRRGADAAVRQRARALQADSPCTRACPSPGVAALLRDGPRLNVIEGAHTEAAPLFERALSSSLAERRAPEVERELHAAWEAAGQGGEIEARVTREAASGAASPADTAPIAGRDIAERREARGDRPGAVRALLEACKLDPAPMVRWSALERGADVAGDDEARVTALERIAERVGDDGRVPVFRRLAPGVRGIRARRRRREGDLGAGCSRSIPRTRRPTTPSSRSSSPGAGTTSSWTTLLVAPRAWPPDRVRARSCARSACGEPCSSSSV